MVLVLASVLFLHLHLHVFLSEQQSQRTPGEGTPRRALSDQAGTTGAHPRLAWEHMALAFLCYAVRDTEISRKE